MRTRGTNTLNSLPWVIPAGLVNLGISALGLLSSCLSCDWHCNPCGQESQIRRGGVCLRESEGVHAFVGTLPVFSSAQGKTGLYVIILQTITNAFVNPHECTYFAFMRIFCRFNICPLCHANMWALLGQQSRNPVKSQKPHLKIFQHL